jgi:hypothetical protein
MTVGLPELSGQASSFFTRGPNVAAECLAFLLRIWELPGSNIDSENGYTDGRFYRFGVV